MTGSIPSTTGRSRTPRPSSLLRRLGLLAAVGLLLVACGGGASVLSTVGSGVGDRDLVGAPAAAPDEQPGDGAGKSDANLYRASDAGTVDGRLIVRTGQLDLQVEDLDDALAAAQAAVAAAGGYVASSQRQGDDDRASAVVTYRLPIERWEATLADLRAVGTKVLAEQTASQEVTSQVVDLGARLANLRATEAALQAIMGKATKIPDILEVQAQLTDVRQQIEQLTAQKESLENQAAFATLTASFSLPPVVAVTQVREGWDPGAEIDRAVATLVGFGQGVANAAIWAAIVILPLLVVLVVSLGLAWLLARRLRPRRTAAPVPTPDVPAA